MRTVPLGDVATVERRGIHPLAIAAHEAYLGLEHIEKGGRILAYRAAGDADLQSTKFQFSAQHVLYGKLRPYLAKIALPDRAGVCSTDILPVLPGPHLDRSYLAHYLRQEPLVDFANSRATGANLPRLSPTQLEQFPVPLPPMEEQRRIAAILDQADAIRTKRRQVLTHLDALKSAVLDVYLRLADRTVPLADIADIQSGITKGRRTTEPTDSVPYLAVVNVQAGRLELTNVKSIEATAYERQRYRLEEGDLLLTEGGDPDKLGRGTVWRDELPECLHQNHIFRVRLNEESPVVPDVLAAHVGSREAKSYFLRAAKQTTGIASINKTQLSQLPVPVLSRSDQERMLQQGAVIDSSAVSAQRALAQDEMLFASLQSRAFRGEL